MGAYRTQTDEAVDAVGTLTTQYRTLTEELGDYQTQMASATTDARKLEMGLLAAGAALGGLSLASLATGVDSGDTVGIAGGLFEEISGVAGQAKGMLDSMFSQVEGLFDIMQAHGGPLREEFFEIQQAFGGTFGAIDEHATGANKQAAEANRAVGEMYEEFYTGIEGTSLTMFDLFEDQSALSQLFHSIAQDNRDAVAFLAGDSRETTESTALAMKALNISQADSALFVQRQIDMTGEANDDLLMNVARTIKATEGATDVSSKIIAANVVDMTKDVKNFGNMTESTMAAASAQLSQMGLDFQSLSSVVGQFQSFEGAAQAAANLNALMGINIDVTEAMTAANQGQHHMMDLVRTSMLDAGVTAENFTDNLAMARATASQYNLEVEDMQRILAAQDVQEIEDILAGQADALAEGPSAEEYTQEDLIRDFDTDMARVQRTIGQTAKQFRDAFTDAQIRAGMSQTQSELALIAEDTERSANSTVRFAGALGSVPGSLAEGTLAGIREGLTGPEGFMGQMKDEMDGLALTFEVEMRPVAEEIGRGMGEETARVLTEQLDAENPTSPMGKLAGSMRTFFSDIREDVTGVAAEISLDPESLQGIGRNIVGMSLGTDTGLAFAEGMTDAINSPASAESVAQAAGELFANMDRVAEGNGYLGESPSPFGLRFTEGIIDALSESDLSEAAREFLSPLDRIREEFGVATSELEGQIAARGAQIASQFTGLSALSLEVPTLAPVEVSLTGAVTKLNEASQALITAATENAPSININLSLELTDEGKGNLIASLANGSISGGQGVLTQRL